MATAYRAPEGFEAPVLSTEELMNGSYEKTVDDYLERLAVEARTNGKSPLLGEIIRFPRGDGYAQYMVWNTRPLELIHLEIMDAWDVEDALIRGLRLKDVKEMVERERGLRELFGKSKEVEKHA